MKSSQQRNRGFTLIELMIVVAIVAILVALAVPAYQDYVVRSKVTECIAQAAVPKLQIVEFYQTNAAWPSSAAQAGVDSFSDWGGDDRSKYCHLVFDMAEYQANYGYNVNAPVNLVIWVSTEYLFDDPGTQRQIAPFLTPSNNGKDWTCTVGWTMEPAVKYLPSSCRQANVN